MKREKKAIESMDLQDCDPKLLDRTYAQFPLVNRFVSKWRQIYVEWVRPVLPTQGPASILDVGCGGGDVAINLARWALHDGFDIQVVGIDPDERAYRFAHRQAQRSGLSARHLEFRRAYSHELVGENARFDVVLSNHLLHHLAPQELAQLFTDTSTLTRFLGLHNDIRRRRSALLFFAAATLPLAGTSFIRSDGLISIRRSYTPVELAQNLPRGWSVHPVGAYRNLAVYKPVEAAGG